MGEGVEGDYDFDCAHHCEFEALRSGLTADFQKIRSIYRLIEFALGVEGYPFSHEWTFYVFESLPMLPAIAVFCFWYPGRYLPRNKFAGIESEDASGKESDRSL